MKYFSKAGNHVLVNQPGRMPLLPLAAFVARRVQKKNRPKLLNQKVRRRPRWHSRFGRGVWVPRACPKRPDPARFSLRAPSLRISDSVASTPTCTYGTMDDEMDGVPADIENLSWLNQYGSNCECTCISGAAKGHFQANAHGWTREPPPFSAPSTCSREGQRPFSAPASPPFSPQAAVLAPGPPLLLAHLASAHFRSGV